MSGAAARAVAALQTLLGSAGFLEAASDTERYLIDHRRLFHGATLGVARPSSPDEVVGIVKICAAHGISLVPQGGNTSYCGGATPDPSGAQLVVSMERLRAIRTVDAAGYSLIAEAGCTLAQVQAAAAAADRLFPLSLGSEGTAQIGGNVSTNAGGTAVLRYGVTRELVLGLEVVLADGRVVDQLKPLRKDNTGYDVKQYFIGAEGSLGIITAVCCKLFPLPAQLLAAMAGVDDLQAAVTALGELRSHAGDNAVTFEVMPRAAVELAVRELEHVRDPFDAPCSWYIFTELSVAPFLAAQTQDAFTQLLSDFIERGILRDAVLATSDAQREGFWRMREGIPEAQTRAGPSIKHDISLPITAIPAFVTDVVAQVRAVEPRVTPITYGHLGDGNLHFNFSLPRSMSSDEIKTLAARVQRLVHDEVARRGGSFSAEHGIGQLKVGELERYEDPVALDVMRRVKRALDPDDLMNPGKVLRR